MVSPFEWGKTVEMVGGIAYTAWVLGSEELDCNVRAQRVVSSCGVFSGETLSDYMAGPELALELGRARWKLVKIGTRIRGGQTSVSSIAPANALEPFKERG